MQRVRTMIVVHVTRGAAICQHAGINAIVRVVVAKCLIAIPYVRVREETVIYQSVQLFANVVVKAIVTCLFTLVNVIISEIYLLSGKRISHKIMTS